MKRMLLLSCALLLWVASATGDVSFEERWKMNLDVSWLNGHVELRNNNRDKGLKVTFKFEWSVSGNDKPIRGLSSGVDIEHFSTSRDHTYRRVLTRSLQRVELAPNETKRIPMPATPTALEHTFSPTKPRILSISRMR
jgi:hypothetical protein